MGEKSRFLIYCVGEPLQILKLPDGPRRNTRCMEHLPLWFLILALFLPRIALLIAYLARDLVPYHLQGWMPPTLGILLPRILIILLIFQDRGMSVWLLVHGAFMAAVCASAGRKNK